MTGVRHLRAALTAPVLIAGAGVGTVAVQARIVRRRTPRLPDAGGPPSGCVGDGPELRIALAGESTVAGVGLATQSGGLGATMAQTLSEASGGRVTWVSHGWSGARVAGVTEHLLPRLEADLPIDAVVIAIGVNDVLRLTPRAAWRRHLTDLVVTLRTLVGPVPVVMAGIPELGRSPALPRPLRTIIGARTTAFDRDLIALAAHHPEVHHAPTPWQGVEDLGIDRFHPSPGGYARWGHRLAQATHRALRAHGHDSDPMAPRALDPSSDVRFTPSHA